MTFGYYNINDSLYISETAPHSRGNGQNPREDSKCWGHTGWGGGAVRMLTYF